MKILIVAATKEEIASSIPFLEQKGVDFLITGVGMVATAYALGQRLQAQQYDLIVNVGIAGSFSRTLQIGEVVQITQDHLIELGAEDRDSFVPIDELGFGQSLFRPAHDGLSEELGALKKVNGITVNTVHGNESSIQKITNSLTVDTIESMEGAAVFYAAERLDIPVIQVRTISNYVEPRDRGRWNIGLAVKNLNDWLETFLSLLASDPIR